MDLLVHLCCARCSRWTRYARDTANLMQMRDFIVEVEHDPPSDERALATVEVAEGRRLMRMRFHALFDELTLEEQRYAVVHELVHPLLHPLTETVRSAAADEFGGAALRMFLGVVSRDVERTVDTLANVIAPSLPLPGS